MFKSLPLARLFPAFLLLLIASSSLGVLATQQDQAERPEEIEFIVVDTPEQFPISEYDIDEKWHLEDAPRTPFWQGVHYYFSGAGFALSGIQDMVAYARPDLFMHNYPKQDLSPEYSLIAQETVIKMGGNPNDIHILGVTVPDGNVALALGKDHLLIDPAQSSHITRPEQEFIVAHEYAHLQQRHVLKRAILAITLPFAVHYATKAWDSTMHRTIIAIKKAFKITSESTLNKVLNKIDTVNHWISTFWLTKAAIIGCTYQAYSRYTEKQADIAAIKSLKTSEGGQALFERYREMTKIARTQNPANVFKIDENGDNIIPNTHPRLSERIEYIRNYVHST